MPDGQTICWRKSRGSGNPPATLDASGADVDSGRIARDRLLGGPRSPDHPLINCILEQ